MISWRCITFIRSILHSLVFFDIIVHYNISMHAEDVMSYVLAIRIALPPMQGVYIHQQYLEELSGLKGGQDLSFVLLDNALFANNPKWHFKLGCYTTNFFLLNENKLSICSRPVKSNRVSARRLAGLFELKFYVLCMDANQRIKSKVFL